MPAGLHAQQHLYADPHVYHVLHAPGTRAEVSVIVALAREVLRTTRRAPVGPREKLVFLEPASGSGRYLIDLARRGHSGFGLDLSDAMTRYATRAAARAGVGARARFIMGDMTRFSPTDFAPAGRSASTRGGLRADAAFCTINSVRHLMSDKAMLAHLACVRACLVPGGVYIIGVETVEPAFAQETEDVWVGVCRTRPRLRVQQVVQFVPAVLGGGVPAPGAGVGVNGPAGKRRERDRVETVHSHLTIRVAGCSERHTDSTYHLRTYTHAEWTGVIAKARWRVAGVFNAAGEARPEVKIGYYLWAITPV